MQTNRIEYLTYANCRTTVKRRRAASLILQYVEEMSFVLGIDTEKQWDQYPKVLQRMDWVASKVVLSDN